MGDPTIRRATAADIPAVRALLTEHGNDGPVINGDIVGPYLAHVIGTGVACVSVIDNRIVGYGATSNTGRSRHLADLFVATDRLGQGIGRPLLDAAFAGAPARTTFASDDPRAMPLYIRAGMAPLWTCLYLEGIVAAGHPGSELAVTQASGAELAALELAWTGYDRAADHRYWESVAGADPFIVGDETATHAFGYGRVRQASAARALDRLVIHPDADPRPVVFAALARVGRNGRVLVSMPGPHPVLRTLLEAGFRIADRDTFMASDPDLVDPVRLLPNPGLL